MKRFACLLICLSVLVSSRTIASCGNGITISDEFYTVPTGAYYTVSSNNEGDQIPVEREMKTYITIHDSKTYSGTEYVSSFVESVEDERSVLYNMTSAIYISSILQNWLNSNGDEVTFGMIAEYLEREGFEFKINKGTEFDYIENLRYEMTELQLSNNVSISVFTEDPEVESVELKPVDHVNMCIFIDEDHRRISIEVYKKHK